MIDIPPPTMRTCHPVSTRTFTALGLALAIVPQFAAALFTGNRSDLDAQETIQFSRDIQPILADNCFLCHGPDESSRQAGLRLDLADHATALLASGRRAIVPGDVDASELIQRISSPHAASRMPPEKSTKHLEDSEIELLRHWIAAGAPWEQHWAWRPIAAPPVPPVANESWADNEIDSFVVANLEEEGIDPSGEADRETLLRRVTFDLTGMPPSLGEIDAFLADPSPVAFARVVDRLLASPRFGERMATAWLDAARYADSYGYQSDQLSPTWPYRDWVVRAFNDNLRHDEFLRWQLAGDLIPNATREQRLATAFNRLHRMTNEGGSIEEEFRTEYAADRVNTFGTVFLGLTLGCARCHDHKFDPITAREYYSLLAFFNNIDEWGMYHDSSRVPTPSLLLPTPDQEAVLAEREMAARRADDALRLLAGSCDPTCQRLLEKSDEPKWPMSGLLGHYDFDRLDGQGQIPNLANVEQPGQIGSGNALAPGRRGLALQFTGDDAGVFPLPTLALNPWEPFSVAFWIHLPDELQNAVLFHRSGGTDVGRFGTELSLHEGCLRFGQIRSWPGNAIAIQAKGAMPSHEWCHVAVTSNGSARASGMTIFVNGSPAASDVLVDSLTKSPAAGGSGIDFGARFRDAGLRDARLDDLFLFNRPLAAVEVAQLHDGHSLLDAMRNTDDAQLREYSFLALNETAGKLRQVRSQAIHAVFSARDPVTEVMVMQERGEIRPTYWLERGAYDAAKTPERRVERTTPRALGTFPPDASRDRLGLANWLIDSANPLTARVAVNRFWHLFFGRGIVLTGEDFGVQGSRPTHPELLDWLAEDFRANDWNVKRLCRQIVTSATYRQVSTRRKDLQQTDPDNTLLARGPSGRLAAEMLRDLALAASGLLDETVGGPPVSPYQPAQFWRELNSMSPAYCQSVGDALYRRSLYTVWKRTAPMPNMIAFDAPGREDCTVRRSETNTPGQALVLLNDPQFVEAARVLAERALQQGSEDESARITFVFRSLTGRHPTKPESRILLDLVSEQRGIYAEDTEAAASLAAVGERAPEASLDPVEVAAWTNVVQAVLNLDATVWKR